MSNNIGLYFKNALPTSIPTGDDFAYYFIKNTLQETINLPEGNTTSIPMEFNNIFFGKKNPDNSSTFFQINKGNNFYFRTINGIVARNNQGYINLTLDDVVKYGGTTNVLKINTNYLYSETTDVPTLFFGSYTSELNGLTNINKKSFIKNKFDKTIFVGHLGYTSTNVNQVFSNSTLLINKLFINYQTVNNSIFIGNDIIVQDINTTNIYDNNLNIGGSYIDTVALSANPQNKIEGNIFIKNLGYGNIGTSFRWMAKINLMNVDSIVNYTTLDILYRNTTGIIERITTTILFKPLNDRIDTVQSANTNISNNVTNLNNNITDLNSKYSEFKSIYNYNTNTKRLFAGFNVQSNYEENSFTVNLDSNNNNYFQNIIISRYISGLKSYFKLNAKLFISSEYIVNSQNNALFQNKLTYNESSGEVGFEIDTEKNYVFTRNYNATLGKNIDLKIVYNQALATIHIHFPTAITIVGFETIELNFNLDYLIYHLKTVWDQPSINLGTGYSRGVLAIEIDESLPGKIFIKSLISDTISCKIAHSITVPTTI